MRRNITLKPYNSFGLDVMAAYVLPIVDLKDIEQLMRSELWKLDRRLVLGGGSNTLFLDDYFEGLVLLINNKGISMQPIDNDRVKVSVAAGEDWTNFVQRMVAHGLSGLENLSLIPGKVGASPIQNIGAYGVELKDTFHSLQAFDTITGELVDFDAADCEFAYRSSIFKTTMKGRYIILSVDFILHKTPRLNTQYGSIREELSRMGVQQPCLHDVSIAISNIRRSKLPDPLQLGNAGSFFKNPLVHRLVFEDLKREFPGIVGHAESDQTVKLSAAWLIEKAGWKGRRTGDVGVHQDQALVIVNYGNATGRDIFSFAMEIQQAVRVTYGIQLEPEVNFV